MQDDPHATPALARLEVLVGEWSEEAAGAPAGRVVTEWGPGRRFLIQRSEIPQPEFPDSLVVIAANQDGETYTQHYFDSRGVVRLYKMSLDGRTMTLLRDAPDFTPLDFAQRFVGTIAEDGSKIEAMWQTASDGEHWEKDFDIVYRKIG
jgi:hypothetical protein